MLHFGEKLERAELNKLLLRIEVSRKEVGEEMEKHMSEDHVPDDSLIEMSARLGVMIVEYFKANKNELY